MTHRVALVLLKEEYDLPTLWEQTYRAMRHDFQADVWKAVASIVCGQLPHDPQLINASADQTQQQVLRQVPVNFLVFPNLTTLLRYLNDHPNPKIDAVVVDMAALIAGITTVTATASQQSCLKQVAMTKTGIKPRPVIGVGSLFREQLANQGCDKVCAISELPTTIDKVLEPHKHEHPST